MFGYQGALSRWHLNLSCERTFAKYPVARGSAQIIMGWDPHAREPEIISVAIGPQRADHAVIIPPRRKPKRLPLFARAARHA
jgi:hypothetical protein